MFKKLSLIVIFLALIMNVSAQDDEMNADRPDQTEEVHLVPKKRFMVESGFISTRFDSGRNALIVRTMLRYGITKGVEIGLLTEQGRERNRYIEETVQSTYPVAARLKVALLEKHKWLPDITLVSYVQLPFGKNDEGKNARGSISALLAFMHELSDKWRFEYNAGFQQEAFDHKFGWQVYTSLHYKLTEKLESFVGSYSQFERDQHPFHNMDAGLAYKIKEHFQVDIAGGTSINYHEQNEFLTVGFAVML
jgi:outer membrane putative beta-barrel porin/alpha-amylase